MQAEHDLTVMKTYVLFLFKFKLVFTVPTPLGRDFIDLFTPLGRDFRDFFTAFGVDN